MSHKTKLNIDLETGNFVLISEETIFEKNEKTYELGKILEKHEFKTVWTFENELLELKLDEENVIHILNEPNHPLYKRCLAAKEQHFSVMRYERF